MTVLVDRKIYSHGEQFVTNSLPYYFAVVAYPRRFPNLVLSSAGAKIPNGECRTESERGLCQLKTSQAHNHR